MSYVLSGIALLVMVVLFRLSVPGFKFGDKQTSIWGGNENVFPRTPNIKDVDDFKFYATNISNDPIEVAGLMNTYRDASEYLDYYSRACRSITDMHNGGLPILALVDVYLILKAFFPYWTTINALIFFASFAVAVVLCHYIIPHTTITGLEEQKVRLYIPKSKEDVDAIYKVAHSYAWAARSIDGIAKRARGFQVAFFIYSGILLAACIFSIVA